MKSKYTLYTYQTRNLVPNIESVILANQSIEVLAPETLSSAGCAHWAALPRL